MHIQEDGVSVTWKKGSPSCKYLSYNSRTTNCSGSVKSFGRKETMAAGQTWVWSAMWIALLLILVWPLSMFAATLYICFLPFTACCECTFQLTEFLHKGINLPQLIGSYIASGRTCEGL